MFERRVTLFKLLGFSVRIDISWVVIASLVTWSLATGLFPHRHENLPAGVYWIMGAIGAIGLFASIVFHELCHSLVARWFGLSMSGITLFIFGGVAEMDEEPASAKIEFLMAIAGPLSSILLALFFFAMGGFGNVLQWPDPVTGVIGYLGLINMALAIFNLVPAFPLDGGRILRAALWSWKDNIRWATRVASRIGSGFGLVLIFMGLFSLLSGNVVGGIWWFMIGMFLRNAAGASYKQLITRQALQGEPVGRFMEPQPVTVPPSVSIADFIEDYVYRYHFKMFPVVDQGRVSGCVSTRQVKDVPREDWSLRTIGEIAVPCSDENTISPDADSLEAISRMNRARTGRLMVLDGDNLVGIISLKDLLKFLALKVELEEN
jgi:Zn-dependent protease/predicted transcriptional regulator